MAYRSATWVSLGLLLCASCSTTITDAEGLRAALGDAASGDVIVVAAGSYEGPFDVRPGVTVEGQGVGLTTVVAPADLTAITLQPGASEPTGLRNLTVIAAGRWAVSARGPGEVSLEDVDLSVPARGAGFGAEGVTALTLRRVRATGPVQSTDMPGATPSTSETGTHGVDVFDVGSALFDEVSIRGFAVVGSLLVRSTVVWQGGSIRETAGAGLFALGGTTSLMGTEIQGVFAPSPGQPTFGVIGLGSAELNTIDATVADSEGRGLFLGTASGTHSGLTLMGNQRAGLWMQNVSDFSAVDTTAMGNGVAGVVVRMSSNVSFDGLTVGDTQTRRTTNLAGSDIMVGDGLQIIDSLTDLVLQNASVMNNGRVGLLLDAMESDLSSTTLEDIVIEGTGSQLGAVMQGASVPGWDDGITRMGETAINDEALTADLDLVGVVAPADLPLSGAATAGIEEVVAPAD